MSSFKQRDIKPCALCGNGLMHKGDAMFYRICTEVMVFDAGAVQRQHGLEMMMGGNAHIASVMGPDEDMAMRILGTGPSLICRPCAHDNAHLMMALVGDGQ